MLQSCPDKETERRVNNPRVFVCRSADQVQQKASLCLKLNSTDRGKVAL